MKKQIFILFFASLFCFVGCSDDDSSTPTTSENFVRFGDGVENIEVSEASGTVVSLPVTMNDYQNSGVTVNYTLTGDAGSYEILSGGQSSVSIEPGKRQAFIKVRPIDNSDFNDPANSLTITLTGVDGSGILASDAGAGFMKKTITFLDNECQPGARDTWVGSLDAEDVGYGTVSAAGATTDDNCAALIITGNLPNSGSGLEPDFVFVLDGDDSSGTITCSPQAYGNNTYQATGTYDVATKTINVTYEYRRADGSLIWDGTNIIKPI